MQYLDGHQPELAMQSVPEGVPFYINEASEPHYRVWRQWKLAHAARQPAQLLVPIHNPYALTPAEVQALRSSCLVNNMVIYSITDPQVDVSDKNIVQSLGQQLGLVRLDANLCADEDSITALQVIEGGRQKGYIPYSNFRLSWHTDGYYNADDKQIRGMALHCVRAALEGGENALLDHELLYIHLRDSNPEFIRVLMQPDAMTIPPNVENGVEIRGAQTGPVFSVDPASQSLHCRYSARTRNIEWKDDGLLGAAVKTIEDFLNSDSPAILRYRLQPGQGLLCNNVLHNRTGFSDGETLAQQRLIYRARYYDRIVNTGFSETLKAMQNRQEQ